MPDKVVRLNKVVREFNVSLDRVVDFLSSKGHKIAAKPTIKISQVQYDLLKNKFSQVRFPKSISKNLSARNHFNLSKKDNPPRQRVLKKTNDIPPISNFIDKKTLNKLNELKEKMLSFSTPDKSISVDKQSPHGNKIELNKDGLIQVQAQNPLNRKIEEIKKQKYKIEEEINIVDELFTEKSKYLGRVKLILSDNNFKSSFSKKNAVRFYPNINKKHPNVKGSYYLLPYTYKYYENVANQTIEDIIKSVYKEVSKPTFKSVNGKLMNRPKNRSFVKIVNRDSLKSGALEKVSLLRLVNKIKQKHLIFSRSCKIYYERVFAFKRGVDPELSAAIFFELFGGKEFFRGKILIPISSSKKDTNIKRYKDFINLLCAVSEAINGFNFFEIEEKNEKHKTQSRSKIIFKKTNNEYRIKNKKVVLIDDMFTMGNTADTWISELNKWSPLEIESVFLSKALDRNKYFKKHEKARILIPGGTQFNSPDSRRSDKIGLLLPFWTLRVGVTLKFDFCNLFNVKDGDIVEVIGPSIVKGFIDVQLKDDEGNYFTSLKKPDVSPLSIPEHFLVKIESSYDYGKACESPPF